VQSSCRGQLSVGEGAAVYLHPLWLLSRSCVPNVLRRAFQKQMGAIVGARNSRLPHDSVKRRRPEQNR
jgi:hypothetical protein